jgi:hypothetical protein
VRCQFPAHLWIGFFFLSSHLCCCCWLSGGGGGQTFPAVVVLFPSHLSLSLLRRLVFSFYSFLHFQSRFYGDIPRNYMLISCGLWPRCVLACIKPQLSHSNPTVLEEPLSSSFRSPFASRVFLGQ